jgi:hypothetical protein
MEPEESNVPALRVEVKEKTPEAIAEAIKRALEAEPTDLFTADDTLVLLVQHQLGGKRTAE